MSRSVSAPSSVTNTSPCWNGLIVPGSTFRYGSNFWSCTRRPRDFNSRPSDAATMPFPSAETTPPLTKTYFGARALTGFEGSSGIGRRTCDDRDSPPPRSPLRLVCPGLDEVVEPPQRLHGEAAAGADQPRHVDDQRRLRPVARDLA